MERVKFDGFVKSPSAALRCILRRCGVPLSTPHSSEFARLASGAFYFAIQILTFYESIKFYIFSGENTQHAKNEKQSRSGQAL
jgi:hypothetical protein